MLKKMPKKIVLNKLKSQMALYRVSNAKIAQISGRKEATVSQVVTRRNKSRYIQHVIHNELQRLGCRFKYEDLFPETIKSSVV